MIEDSKAQPFLWFLSRGAGIIALVLLTVSVILGIVAAGRWQTRLWPRFATEALHRNVSMLAILLLVAHVFTIEMHVGEHVEWIDAVLPYGSKFRPIWTGLGALSGDIMVALIVTSWLRRFIGPRVWKTLHWAGYIAWLSAVVHTLGTGTDTRAPWSLPITAACVAVVLLAVLFRITRIPRTHRAGRSLALAATVIVLAVLGWWAATGPLDSDWPRRAGTQTPAPSPAPATGHPAPGSPR